MPESDKPTHEPDRPATFAAQLAAAYRSIDPAPGGARPGATDDTGWDVAGIRDAVARRRRGRATALVAAAAVATGVAVGSWVVVENRSDGPDTPSATLPVSSFGSGASEVRASHRISDWASQADVLVTATVVGEKQTRVSPLDDGTDAAFVGRTVTLQVQTTPWSAEGVTVPSEISLKASGWLQRGGRLVARLAPSDASRLEVGHTYVLALLHDRCGNPWSLVGSGAALPYDKEVLGDGELRGVEVEAGDARATGLTSEFAGRSVDDIADALKKSLDQGSAKRGSLLC